LTVINRKQIIASPAQDLTVLVAGDLACFTRPEMKIERVSYPAMTPSAARGVLEAIFWKPEFQWQIHEIWILNNVRWVSMVRNEVKHKASVAVAGRWARNGGFFDARLDHTLRHTLALRDVSYLIRASIALARADRGQEAAFRDQFRRRVLRGACFHRPYLGCREFAAYFSQPIGNEKPIQWNADLGLMFCGMEYGPHGPLEPRFFTAVVREGVLRIPLFLTGQSLERSHAA